MSKVAVARRERFSLQRRRPRVEQARRRALSLQCTAMAFSMTMMIFAKYNVCVRDHALPSLRSRRPRDGQYAPLDARRALPLRLNMSAACPVARLIVLIQRALQRDDSSS